MCESSFWLDLIIGICTGMTTYGAFSTVITPGQKPPLSQSGLNCLGGFPLVVAYFWFALWGSFVIISVNTVLWGIVTFQRYKLNMRLDLPHFAEGGLLLRLLRRA